jgi:hypothetical protein
MMQHQAAKNYAANLNFDSEEHQFEVPVRKIFEMNHVQEFQSSSTCVDLTMFMIETMKAIKGSKMTETPITPKC